MSAPRDPEGNPLTYDPGRDEPWSVEMPDTGHDPTVDDARPPLRRRVADTQPPVREATSWRPVDLRDAISGSDVDPPTMFPRADGLHLIYPGKVHSFMGETESCKSWAAQVVVAEQINAGHDVLYVDFEDDERGVVSRLLALGVKADEMLAHLVYVRPAEPLGDRNGRYTDGALDLFDVLDTHAFTLCVVDGVTEAMTIEGMEIISNVDIARWMRLLPKRIAHTGTAVITVDHVVKDREGQGRWAIGGQHKLAGLSGAAYRFTVVRPLARAPGADSVEAAIAVRVGKDRPGYVRGRCPEGKVGTLHLTAYPDGGVSAHLEPPGGASEIDMAVAARILDYLLIYDGSSQTKIENVEGNATAIRRALRWMAEPDRAWLRVEHKGQAHLHWLTDAGRTEAGRG